MKRRKFLESSVKGAVTLGVAPVILTGTNWRGANDRINVGVIGIRGQGLGHVEEFQSLKNVAVTALCDVDENLFADRIKSHFTDKNLPQPKIYNDLRKLIENKDIDAVSIATPNHWHALAAIWAIQAGKHVSVEKPCCHTVVEGRKLVEAAKKYNRVVQDGAEQRSNPCAQSAVKFMSDGKLGEVYLAKGVCYKWRDTIGKFPDGMMEPYTEAYMKKVNYDLWLGPAPERAFNKNRFHYNWHWHWDYGNGDMGNQGVHEMDIARWGLGVKLPTRVSAMGGHFMFEDAQETPNTLMAVFEFPNPGGTGDKKKILEFETRHWMTNPEGDHLGVNDYKTNNYMTSTANVIGNIFYGSKGYMQKDVTHWQTFMGKERIPGESGGGLGNHFQVFAEAIRANDPGLLTSSIEEGFYSCALIHLANISYRLGRSFEFDPQTMQIKNDPEANRMLTKDYRKPFVLPKEV